MQATPAPHPFTLLPLGQRATLVLEASTYGIRAAETGNAAYAQRMLAALAKAAELTTGRLQVTALRGVEAILDRLTAQDMRRTGT